MHLTADQGQRLNITLVNFDPVTAGSRGVVKDIVSGNVATLSGSERVSSVMMTIGQKAEVTFNALDSDRNFLLKIAGIHTVSEFNSK